MGSSPHIPGPGLCPDARPPSASQQHWLDSFVNLSPPDLRVACSCPAVPDPSVAPITFRKKPQLHLLPVGHLGGPSLPTSFALSSFGSPAQPCSVSCALPSPLTWKA